MKIHSIVAKFNLVFLAVSIVGFCAAAARTPPDFDTLTAALVEHIPSGRWAHRR